MTPIKDLSWRLQTAAGHMEEFNLNGCTVRAVHIPPSAKTHKGGYRYRLLFFPPGFGEPVRAINLESSILEDWLLTEEKADSHRVLRRFEGEPSWDEFRMLALEAALGE